MAKLIFFIVRGIKKPFSKMKLLLSQINYSSAGKNYIENGLAVKLIMFWATCLLLVLQWCVRLWQWSRQSHTVLCIPSSKRGLLSLVPGYLACIHIYHGRRRHRGCVLSVQISAGNVPERMASILPPCLFCSLNRELYRVFPHQSFLF